MNSRPSNELSSSIIKAEAHRLGFFACGIAKAEPVDEMTANQFRQWIESGGYADMDYMARNMEKRLNPTLLMPGAKSIISVALSYAPAVPLSDKGYEMAAYALGRDYHEIIKQKLRSLAAALGMQEIRADQSAEDSATICCRIFCDTAPVLERYWAEKAGLGWTGHNHQLIIPKAGSMFFLGELFTNAPLDYDVPCANHCGNCHRCESACPTQAIAEPFHLHPQRCVGFNNWFRQDEKGVSPVIPEEIRPAIGMHFHGCDICQEVCPRNKAALEDMKVHGRKDPLLEMIAEKFDPEKLLFLDDDYYRETVQPIMFNYIHDYRYFRRNAALVMGNSGDPKYLPALHRAEKTEEDEMVREMIAWAIGRLDAAAPQISA